MKAESDINSFLGGEQISFLANKIKGLDDFELVCFLVVRDAPEKSSRKDAFRLVIAGSREFADYSALISAADAYLQKLAPKKPIVIVSGTAKGADRLGEQVRPAKRISTGRAPCKLAVLREGSRCKTQRGNGADRGCGHCILGWSVRRGEEHDRVCRKSEHSLLSRSF